VLPRYGRLSAIVILVGASDVLRWLEEGAPARPSSRVPVDELFACHPERPFGWTPGALAAVELARRARLRIQRPEQVHTRTGHWIGKARAMRARAKVIHATMPDPGPMLAHFEKHLHRVIVRARAHAGRVVLVRQSWYGKEPLTAEELAHMWHGGVGQAWREEVTTYYSVEVTAKLMALLDASAARVARALDVDQIDLMSVLDPNLSTYYDFFHLTPFGARTVADAVARTLLRQHAETAAGAGELPTCADLRAS
jgi:hypothetical protein